MVPSIRGYIVGRFLKKSRYGLNSLSWWGLTAWARQRASWAGLHTWVSAAVALFTVLYLLMLYLETHQCRTNECSTRLRVV
jgi:hypothetical protein